MKRKMPFVLVLAAALCAAAETLDLVSARGVDATAWTVVEAPAEGTFTARIELPGFTPSVRVVTKEPRDPNAFFTDVPGVGGPVPVGVGLADGAAGAPAKNGEKKTLRVVVPVPEAAAAGVHKGKLAVACGGKTIEREIWLRVLDFTLPPAKSRYSGLSWSARLDGAPLPADWTLETSDTYAKNAADVKVVAGSLRRTKNDLQAERWRTLGVPYHAVLDVPRCLDPDAWRRAAGVRAWKLAFDGVVLPPGFKPEPVVAAGLEDAAIDVAYLSYASELANRLADKRRQPELKITYEGRLGQFWVDRVNADSENLDLVRLEAQARIVRLRAFVEKGVAK